MPYYLEQVNDSTGKGEVKIPELRIQKNDLLSIQINSIATDPKIDGLYNLPSFPAQWDPKLGIHVT